MRFSLPILGAALGTLLAAPAASAGGGHDLRFGDGLRGRTPVVIGFIGCDMHAPGGPEVALVQIARARGDRRGTDEAALLGERCADALVRLQARGLRLGQSRVLPGATEQDPDCLAWDLVGQDIGPF